MTGRPAAPFLGDWRCSLAAAAWHSGAASAPAGPFVSHGPVSQLTIAVAGGFAGVIGVMIAQAARDYGRDRRQLYRAAGAPGIEAAAIAEAVGGRDLDRRGISGVYKMRAVPRGAYGGILSSGVLSRFDLQAQEMLYRFYWACRSATTGGSSP